MRHVTQELTGKLKSFYMLKFPTMRIHDEEAVIEVYDTCAYTHMNIFLYVYNIVLKSLTMRIHDEETVIEVYDTCAYTHIYIYIFIQFMYMYMQIQMT